MMQVQPMTPLSTADHVRARFEAAGLLPVAERIARLEYISVDDLFAGPSMPSITRGRRAIALELHAAPYRKSWREIARLLGRDQKGIRYLAAGGVEYPTDVVVAVERARSALRCA